MKSIRSMFRCKDRDELFRTLSQDLPVGVCIIQDEKFAYVNDAFSISVGYTVNELLARDSLEIVVPEDREMVRENTIKMLKGELFTPYQFRVTCKDGSIARVMATVKSIQYHGRLATLWNYMEITGRRQLDEALTESEERYRELANSITDVFFAMDEHLRYTYWNKASETLTGIRAEDALGKSLEEIFPDAPGRTIREKVYRTVLKTGQPQTVVSDYTDPEGRHHILEMAVYPSRGGISVFGRDITERKQAQETLRQSEERYRTMLEEMEEGYYEVDIAGNFTFVNDAMCRILGYSRDELIGMNYKTYTPKEDVKAVFEAYDHVHRTGEPLKWFPMVEIKKDGTLLFVEDSVFPVRNDQGEVTGLRGVSRDVTERKQAEEALRQSEERYRTILDEMDDSYFEVDLGGHLTFVNNSLCRALGYSIEELIGMSYKRFTAEDHIESVFRAFNEVYRTGVTNKGFPWKIIRKDGAERVVEAMVSPQRNTKGAIIGFRGAGRDITERKQTEERLRQSEENHRALFNNSVIGTIVLDAENGKVVMINQAAARTFGFNSVEEAEGADLLDFIRPDDKERVSRIARENFFGQTSGQTDEFEAVTKDGREIWINAAGSRIMHQGKLAGLISFTDITEQKRQNERLMLTDRLVSLGELAAGAAHELNNPLTSIIGFSQLLMEREVPDDIREDLKLINSEAQRAVSVTRNLLTFARKSAPLKEPNQINNIIGDALRLRAYEQGISGIEVERQLDPNLPEVMVDYFQMQQVFMNIIINAEYFMLDAHNKGTLTIATKEQDGRVMILFTDDGPGIPPENMGRIFDPFFTTKEAGKGTGLGLSICHGIVTEHGGQIYAKSELGKGATFVVELPVNTRRPRESRYRTPMLREKHVAGER